ncbi:putative UDP-glucose-4-epimerase [Halobacteriovorax marinus SJ]|uniref:UDP-glucose-4-epimerase n=1 Tax=Halobacteriovorax marinus (strain ATCC BAA-682 / DSM 15412 / SJ) TaxID=862908 RepID=E1WZV7_HALMS|nr:SDR family oxidoreductase [Halobacteriovorax marinus]CBW27893.1 putative UDP-glucose-4-epimerase [Halobacteriovorax marinus SJ]
MSKVIFGSKGLIGKRISELSTTKEDDCWLSRSDYNLENEFKIHHQNKDIIFSAGIPRSKEDTRESQKRNLKMIQNTILSLDRPKSFTFLSSVEVYGNQVNEKISEETPLNPHNYYAEGKVLAEESIKDFFKNTNVNVNILRLPGVYSQESMFGLFGAIRRSISRNEILKIQNNGEDLRDFIFCDDISIIIDELLKKNRSHLLNIATGESTSVANICKYIQRRNSDFNFKLESSGPQSFNLIFETKMLNKSLPNLNLTSIYDGITKCDYFS